MPTDDWGFGADSDDGDTVANEDAARDPDASVTAPDPTRDLPSPSVEVPDPTAVADDADADDGAEDIADVPDDLWVSFWYLVVVFNLAVLAFGLGLLFLALGDDPDLGGRLLFAGAVLAAYGYYKYRTNPYRDGVDADADAGG